jgi:predicted Zn-dependent peptidase
MKRISLLLAVALLAVCAAAQDIASFEKRITLKTLPHGLTIIICERPEAPVFAFFTMVDSGSYQDPMGKTGLAHMFEHMAFKGTRTIGTTNYAAEKAALEKVEKTYAAYTASRNRRIGRDEAKLETLRKEWRTHRAQRRGWHERLYLV